MAHGSVNILTCTGRVLTSGNKMTGSDTALASPVLVQDCSDLLDNVQYL